MKNEENGFTTYNSLLKLDGCKVNYTTSIYGNVLGADFIKPGNMEVMENIHYSFLETSYSCKDSKDYPQILKRLTNENLKRKIELLETDLKNKTSKKMLLVEMDKKNSTVINFLNK